MISTSKSKANIYPWQIVRLLPNMQQQLTAQFHRRSDADGYLRTLQRLSPKTNYAIVFVATLPPAVEKGQEE
jgi:hypothetical protein